MSGLNTQTQKNAGHGNYYSLQEHFSEEQLDTCGYHGCGNGFVTVDKATGKVHTISYADDGVTVEREQNINMCGDAGRVIWENVSDICYRANFSCWSACLF